MESLRLAVVGVMGKGRQHARQVPKLKGATLAALVDHNPAAAALAAELGVPFFSDIQALIKASAADAVICAVPHPVHREVEVPSLEAGLHVLSEKPLAATPSDARAIVAAAQRNHRVLAMMFQYRQRPSIRKARELLAAGAVGPWYYASMHYAMSRSQAYYDARAWRGTWAGEGGGVLINQAAHPIEILIHLLGAFPTRVTAFAAHVRHRMQTEDLSTAVLEFAGGAQASLHADTIQLPLAEYWTVWGDKGQLHVEDATVRVTRVTPDVPTAIAAGAATTEAPTVKVDVESIVVEGPNPKHLGVMQDFVDAIREKRPPAVDGVWGLRCVELHAALLLSAAIGRAVDMPPNDEEYDAFLRRMSQTKA